MSQVDVSAAALESVKSLRQVYTTALDASIAAQKRNVTFMQSIFERGIEELKTQNDTARDVVESVTQNAEKQSATFETLAHQSVDAYMDYLQNVMSYYARGLEAMRQATE